MRDVLRDAAWLRADRAVNSSAQSSRGLANDLLRLMVMKTPACDYSGRIFESMAIGASANSVKRLNLNTRLFQFYSHDYL